MQSEHNPSRIYVIYEKYVGIINIKTLETIENFAKQSIINGKKVGKRTSI